MRSHRVAAGLSQERLAERARLSLRGISDLERGARRSPRLETVRMLSDALNLSQEDRVLFFRVARSLADGQQPQANESLSKPVPSSLPVPPTSLVGRVHEIATIVELLDGASPRLITLTGPGGVGKTRLAQEAAAVVATAFPDGVCLVALASVADHSLVVSATADALGVRETPGVSLRAALERFLRSKRLLLVLDNFEHVLPAAPGVAVLLSTCSGLKVLTTSRVPLRVQGERQVPVSPLGVPGTGRQLSLADVARTEAVQLFVARVQDVRPDFALNRENVEAIVEMCRRLDGLPLALELAAVRVKVLTPHALLRRLERSLPLLTGGAQDLPTRHQALRATIAWSYDLLSPEEQVIFRRLAVFVGGWTLEAAEAVVAPVGALDIFEGLSSLVDQSLVQLVEGLGGEPRYLMLETLREFAVERLDDCGEADDLGRRHADYCLGLAEAGSANLADAAQSDWRAQLRAEQGNIRTALAWLRDRELTHDGLRLATALGGFWNMHGTNAEGRAWMEAFLTPTATTELTAGERVAAMRWTGALAGLEGDRVTAEARLRESLALARRVGDKRGIYTTLGAIAQALLHGGEVGGSTALFDEGIALAREHGDRRETANLLANLAYALGLQGDLTRAETLAAESLALARSYGATRGFEATIAMMFQGWLAIMGGADDLAEERFKAAFALSRELDAKAVQSATLAGLAEVALSRGQVDEAAARYREGLVLGWEGDLPLSVVANLQGLVRVATSQGELARAARLAGALETFGDVIRALPGTVVRKYEADVAHLRLTLGEDAFTAESGLGRTFGPAEIVAEALAVDERFLPPLDT
ncbi:MAG: helix-turn-helix domain-containing protein [Chloroflexia bacterium]|nr:helix-turn-helix domain-containing protein [Chloroflexia bacterium]